jgi:hypothetical protein
MMIPESPMKSMKPRTILLMMAGVAAASLAYNLIGIRWGLPALWYPDEPETIEQIVIPMARHFDPNPHIFHKGSLYYYFLILVLSPYFAFLKLFHVSSENYERLVSQVTLISRAATACVGASGVWVMNRIGRRIGGEAAALTAAFLLAVNLLYAGYAHFAYMEVPMLVLLMVSLLFALRHADTGKAADLRFSAFIGGLAVSTKFNSALPIMVFLLIIHLHRTGPGSGFRAKLRLFFSGEFFASIGLAALGFVCGTPFAVLDFRTFASYMIKQSIIAKEGYKVFTASSSWSAGLELLVKGLGAPLAVAAFFAVLHACVRWFREKEVKTACILFPPILYYIYIGTLRIAAIRYMLPMIPFLLLMFALVDLGKFRKPVRMPLLALFIIVSAWSAVSSFLAVMEFTSDTRYSAEKWISGNLPAGCTVEMYAYKTYLPKFPAGTAAYRLTPNFVTESEGYERFKRNGFAAVALPDAAQSSTAQAKDESDNREAFTESALKLRDPDYIVLSSFYDDRYLPSKTNKTIEMYPFLAKYYQALTSGLYGYDTVSVFRKSRMQEFYVNPTITVLKRM